MSADETARRHFERLYESCFPRVFHYALGRLGDRRRAEAVTEQVLLGCADALARLPDEAAGLLLVFQRTREAVAARTGRPAARQPDASLGSEQQP